MSITPNYSFFLESLFNSNPNPPSYSMEISERLLLKVLFEKNPISVKFVALLEDILFNEV